MKSRIFSSKYIKTISKGQIWIPAFIALGFLLAFPVTGMVKLSSWSDLKYSALQSQILYNNLWKDGFVLSGLIIVSIAAFINSVNGFIYLYSGKKTDYYHGLPMKRSEMFLERVFSGLVYYLIPYIVTEFLMICIGAARGFFSLNIMGMAVRMLCLHLIVYLVIYFSVVLYYQCDGKYADGNSVFGWNVSVRDRTRTCPGGIRTVISGYFFSDISMVDFICFALGISGNVESWQCLLGRKRGEISCSTCGSWRCTGSFFMDRI